LHGPLGRVLEKRLVGAIIEQQEAPIGDAVQDRDRDLERYHPIEAPVD